MRRLGLLVVSLVSSTAVATCVPATDEDDPRGAGGVVLRPSAAARGAPFVTSDGWTVHIDTFAVQAAVAVIPTRDGGAVVRGAYTFSATSDQQMIVPAAPVGPAIVVTTVGGRFIDGLDEEVLSDPPASRGIGADLNARFDQLADSDDPRSAKAGPQPPFLPDGAIPEPVVGPAIVLAIHAEKGTRSLRFDLSIDALDVGPTQGIVVQADALASVALALEAEALFMRRSGAPLTLDDLVTADTDDDGVISPEEARQALPFDASAPPPNGDAGFVADAAPPPVRRSLATTLRGRASRVLSAP